MSSDHFQSSGAIRRRVDGEAREYVFDVLLDGKPVQRDVPVFLNERELRVGGETLALDSVFWVSRRAGLMLLFGRERTLAVLGKSGDLEELARGVERGSDRTAQRSLLQPLTREVVVCTAGTAVSGTIGASRITGLHLAVFTQRGLHLFAGSRSHSLEWPVSRVEAIPSTAGMHGRGGLKLFGDAGSLTLRYLFPEEIQAVARVAVRPPDPVEAPDGAIEMFAKGEVAPPPAPALPEFTRSAEVLHEACERAAGRVQTTQALERRLGPGFFERHFRDLGEVALGPLLLRQSAAAAARTLARAVEALDAERLREDLAVAHSAASDHAFEVYGTLASGIAAERRLPPEAVAPALDVSAERRRLTDSFLDGSDPVDRALERVLARQHMLMQRLQAAEHATPEAGEDALEEAAEAWRKEIRSLDRAYGAAWSDVVVEIADLWSDRLVPRLGELTTLRGPRLSENTRLAILATVTFSVVAALAWLIF